MSNQQEQETDRNVEVWKIKKLIKSLQAARGFVDFKLKLSDFKEIDCITYSK